MKNTMGRASLLLALAVLGGCADQPTAPAPGLQEQPQYSWGEDRRWWNPHDDDDADNDGEFDADLRWIAKYKTPPAPAPVDHMMIGPEGGSLRVGDFEIIVPAGAVSRRVNFRILLPRDPRQAQRAVASFGPHMYFKKPVTIRLPAANTEVIGTPYVMWWSGRFWVPLFTRPTSDGRIEAQVWHFSLYGTSLWSRGWTMAGG
jgi:hypothetical protein